MRKLILASLAAIASGSLIRADDITTASGKKLIGVTVSRVEPDGLVCMSDSGIEKLKFADLPEGLQNKYSYDPAKAAQYSKAVQASTAAKANAAATARDAALRRAEMEKQRVHINGEVINVSSQGILIDCGTPHSYQSTYVDSYAAVGLFSGPNPKSKPRATASPTPPPAEAQGFLVLTHYASKKPLASGDRVDVVAYPAGTLSGYTANGFTYAPAYHAYSATLP